MDISHILTLPGAIESINYPKDAFDLLGFSLSEEKGVLLGAGAAKVSLSPKTSYRNHVIQAAVLGVS